MLTGSNELIFETRPRYAFGRFYVEQPNQDAIAFLCPGELIRQAIAVGSAELEARGDGLGWHYPYHLRRGDDGNTRENITRLKVIVTSRGGALDMQAECEVTRKDLLTFIVRISFDADDLAAIGPEYTELFLA